MSKVAVSDVRSVLIPLADRQLLLPNAVVAEIMGFQLPEVVEGQPAWFLGNMLWRGVLIPVISFEAMLGDTVVTPGHRGRIAIINGMNAYPRLYHYGMVVQAIPSLVRVSTDNVQGLPLQGEADPLIRQAVELDLSPAFIPDLDEIERQLQAVVSKL